MNETGRLDLALRLSVAGMLVAVVGLGAYFGWTVYSDRQEASEATPALRVIKAMREQVRGKPNDAMLRVRLGEAVAAAGKSQEAIEQLNAALKIDPKHTGALLDLGQIAMMNGRPNEAREYFKKVVELTSEGGLEEVNQRREIALYQLGVIALGQKEYAEAIGNFKAALRIRKDASDTYFYLARALDASGEEDGAKEQLKFALAFDPNFAQARFYYGQLLLREGDTVGASEQFQHAVRASPDSKEPKQALAALGKSDELLVKARGLVDKDLSAAYDTIRIACNVDPENFEALKLHAEILVKMDEKDNALTVYKQAQQLEPDNAEVKAAIKELEPKKKRKK
jgi:Tfp pilus assembly protein PilF